MPETPRTFAICINRRFGSDKASCAARGSEQIADQLEAGIRERGLNVQIERLVCFGLCMDGPNGRLIPGGAFLKGMTLDDVPALLDEFSRTSETDEGGDNGQNTEFPAPGT